MASDFAPGVARAQAAGYPIQASIYPPGQQGITLSCDTIAQKIRDGRLDPHITEWASDVVIAAGKPKGVKARVQAILDACRAQFFYAPDPPGSERIASASATACVRPGLCLRVGDCDDLTVLMGSAVMSLGIPVVVVKQNFGRGQQEHVLIKCQDEDGKWLGVDPSSSTLPVGHNFPAVSEEQFDPLDYVSTATGSTEPEFVTIGALPAGIAGLLPPAGGVGAAPRNVGLVSSAPPPRKVFMKDGMWVEYRYGSWWAYVNGKWVKGKSTVGTGAAPQPKYQARRGKWWFTADGLDVELTDKQAKSFGLGATSTTSQATLPTTVNLPSFGQALIDIQGAGFQQQITTGDSSAASGDYSSAMTAYQAAGTFGAVTLGPEIDLSGAPNVTQPYTQAAWLLNAQLATFVPTSATQADATTAGILVRQMLSDYTTAIQQGQAAVAKSNPNLTAGGNSPVGATQVSIAAAGLALAAGVWWGMSKSPKGPRKGRAA